MTILPTTMQQTYKSRIVYDTDVLRQKCEDAEPDDVDDIVQLLSEELKHHFDGIGLSAPQIGINKKIAIVNVFRPLVIVNPFYIKKAGKMFLEEGCLSFPNEFVQVQRYKNIIIDNRIAIQGLGHRQKFGFPINGCCVEEIELECAAVQHEIDHLFGILFYDRKVK